MNIFKFLLNKLESFFNSLNFKPDDLKPKKPIINNREKFNPVLLLHKLIKHNGGRIRKVNIIGFRDPDKPDKWNDYFIINVDNQIMVTRGTTEPSQHYVNEKTRLHPDGAAYMIEGYYEDLWEIGLHRGQYEALVHRGKKIKIKRVISYYPLTFADGKYEKTSGINKHHGNNKRKTIGLQGGGCQVDRLEKVFFYYLETIKMSGQKTFDYLLTSIDNFYPEFKKLKRNRWHYY